jgi:predicted TIM-barrel fold metal-dependent hydrolase
MTSPGLTANDRYVVISSDGHAGADLYAYRDYLEHRYHDEFDAWAEAFVNPWGDLVRPDADRNWDTARRQAELEADGVVAEVLFPNTIPPFFPSGNLVARLPDAEEAELRWAGLRAHNRWLVDFCAEVPGRRAGMVQVFLHDIDAAVAEIRWGREQDLFGGVLLPGVPPDAGLPPLIAPDYEPIWSVCEELDMPVNNHTGQAAPDFGEYDASRALWMIELGWFSHRVFWHLVFGGVFARHPGLKLVLTEQSCGWVPGALRMLDHHFARFRTPGAAEAMFGGDLAAEMTLSPTECWRRNGYAGASFFRPSECALRDEIGVDKIMWGQDYPHSEGTYPYTSEALRATFAGVDRDDVAAMVGGNAAKVYGFDLEHLEPIASRVGPTVAEVAEPLLEYPSDTTCMAFAGEEVKPW